MAQSAAKSLSLIEQISESWTEPALQIQSTGSMQQRLIHPIVTLWKGKCIQSPKERKKIPKPVTRATRVTEERVSVSVRASGGGESAITAAVAAATTTGATPVPAPAPAAGAPVAAAAASPVAPSPFCFTRQFLLFAIRSSFSHQSIYNHYCSNHRTPTFKIPSDQTKTNDDNKQ